MVAAFVPYTPVFAGEGAFGAFEAGDPVLLGVEDLAPFGVGYLHTCQRRFLPDDPQVSGGGALETVAGQCGMSGLKLGALPGSLKNDMRGLVMDGEGSLYTTSQNAILKIRLK